MKDHRFIPYEPDKPLLLPPDIRKWLPEDHLALFISDMVDSLDLSEITAQYAHENGGHPAYHPAMMVKLLFYGYCKGITASREIERETYEDVAFRVLSCDAHPDHSRISDFRKRHLKAIGRLFLQVLEICEAAGMVRLGRLAVDGTKLKANASKHKAMSYDRMKSKEIELEVEIEALLVEAEALDAAQDMKYGKGNRGDELPEDLRFKKARLENIKRYKKELERRVRQEAIDSGKLDKDGNPPPSKGGGGKPPKNPPGIPKPKDQINFTDSESRIMRDGANKSFLQGYNAQAAVDCDSQIIVAAEVTQHANDKQELIPLIDQVEENTGMLPEAVLADTGYFSEANVEYSTGKQIDTFIPKDRIKHTDTDPPVSDEPIAHDSPAVKAMLAKLKTKEGKKIYSKRKTSVEPVFGQIKDARGIRGFLLRGIEQVKNEWKLICLTHNILKLWRKVCVDNRIGAPFFGRKEQFGIDFPQFLLAFRQFWRLCAIILCLMPHSAMSLDAVLLAKAGA